MHLGWLILVAINGLLCSISLDVRAEKQELSTGAKLLKFSNSLGSVDLKQAGTITYDPLSLATSSKQIMWDEELRKLFEEQDPEADAEYRVMLQWDEVHLHASIPACLVKASRYSIVFDISIDSNGNPWHFNILAPASSCSEILSSRGPSAPKRGARVELQRVKYAFRPVLIQQQAELHQDIQTQKSPLQKYWVYMVLCLALMFGNFFVLPQPRAQYSNTQAVDTT